MFLLGVKITFFARLTMCKKMYVYNHRMLNINVESFFREFSFYIDLKFAVDYIL